MDFYVEGDQLQGGDDLEDLYHDENFFILIGKQRMELMTKNTFT